MPSTQQVSSVAPFDPEHLFEPRGAAEPDVASDAEVSLELQLESSPSAIRATGTVTAPWTGVCRRCSSPIAGRSVVRVDERFVDMKGLEDEEAYPITDDHIDLAPLVHDAIFLDLPLAPLCREDCQGLCSQCGIDRNEGSCDCQAPIDPRWAMLENLLGDD
jgi:uncharacterized protein